MNKSLIVITGASSGIGAAMATTFSQAGYPLLLVARRIEKLQALNLDNALCRAVDVCHQQQLQYAITEAEAKFGPVQCLINNAGVMLLGEMEQQDPSEWQRMFDVNVTGLLNGIHTVLSGMKSRQSGTIINISSIAGRKTFPNHTAYCGTKFAVHAISENLREEIADENIRVITIAPGAVETELLSHTSSNDIIREYEHWKHSMGGAIEAKDVAQATLFAFQQSQNICIRELVIAATKQVA